MKEIIIVASDNSCNVAWLRQCLRDGGYSSIACKTAERIIEGLTSLPTCGLSVPLVLIESEVLKNISNGLTDQLSECAPEVPFILLDEGNSQETFERICARRAKFEWDGSPLAQAIEGAGVEVTCG
ncbi:MAG: hypothetical protein ACYTFW_18580 [Planctomycetota bacterium]|jgi:hypothetical protein